MLEYILGFIIGFILVIAFFNFFNNKFQLLLIKFEKAEEDIKLYLDKKNELLLRAKPIIMKELKDEDILPNITELEENYNSFEVHNSLKKNYNDLFKIMDENDKLFKSDTLVDILEDLNTNEENIIGAIKFYNDTVVEYNQLIVAFPSNIISLFRKYKKREFYSNEKREIFEILNNK